MIFAALMRAIAIDEDRIGHIFRNAPGHFPADSPSNRRALVEVASEPENFLGTDLFGNDWFAKTRADGTQIWAQVREDTIMNGGVNMTPRKFDFREAVRLPQQDGER